MPAYTTAYRTGRTGRQAPEKSLQPESVWLYSYGGRATDIWWQNIQGKLSRLDNLTVASISPDTLAGLAGLTQPACS